MKDLSGTEISQNFGPLLNSRIYEKFSNWLHIGALKHHDSPNIGVRRNLLHFNCLPTF